MDALTERNLLDLSGLAKKAIENALERGEFTSADVMVLALYQKERKRAAAKPWYQYALGAAKEITSVMGALKG